MVAVLDTDEKRRAELAAAHRCCDFVDVNSMLGAGIHPKAATVAAPTIHHRAIAAELFNAGIDALIEKPLAPTTADCHAIIEHAHR